MEICTPSWMGTIKAGKVVADGAGEAAGVGESPWAIRASISASNCASRVLASRSDNLAMSFQSGMIQLTIRQDLCRVSALRKLSERRYNKQAHSTAMTV